MGFSQKDSIPVPLDSKAIKDSLVELAIRNNPAMRVSKAEVDFAVRNLNYTRTTWTQNLRVFYNVNDRTYNPNAVTNIPIFGAGLSFSLGDVASLPSRSKMAKARIKSAEGEADLQILELKKEVLTRYNNYVTAFQIYKLKVQELEEAQFLNNSINQKFNMGQVSFDDYTRAAILLSQAKEQRVIAANNLQNAKLLVEEIIVMDLDDLLARFSDKNTNN